jgi:4-amino-4-deoxy-L-arabinose transferase-like glycosyltransferase
MRQPPLRRARSLQCVATPKGHSTVHAPLRVDGNDHVARPLDAPAGSESSAGDRSRDSLDRTRSRWPSPGLLVALLAGAQVTAWTLVPVLTHSSPPLDVVEGYMWGREWVLATYKHPALPSWALEASRLVTGAIGWPAYLLSQACIAASYLFVYLLGRELMGPARAAAGTLLLTGIAFYAWPTVEFNHNIAETPIWAALAWVLWHAVKRQATAWWVLLGALAALSMYAKLASALLVLTIAAWLLWDEDARRRLYSRGPWLGLATFAVLLAPLAYWLLANDFAPLHYAARRSFQGQGLGPHYFIVNVVFNLVGMPAILYIAGLLGPSRRTVAANPGEAPVEAAVPYLAALTLGPLAIAMLGALISGAGLKSAWSSSMFNLAGLLAVALSWKRFAPRALVRIAVCAATLLAVVPIAYGLVVVFAPVRQGVHMRVSWPQAEIARRMTAIWTRETGRPLRIVAGSDWIAGLVGVSAPDRPSLLSKGDRALSPWISAERLRREGVLIVWDASRPHIPKALATIVAERIGVIAREEHFIWPGPDSGNLAIGYAIVAPD